MYTIYGGTKGYYKDWKCTDYTKQCSVHVFCVHLSEAINVRSLIIENQTIQTKYSATNSCVKIIFIIIFMD